MKILFLCTGNSCRSQMAEAWGRALKAGELTFFSAGIAPHGLDPRAVAVMAEAGVDMSPQYSKHVNDLAGVDFDVVVASGAAIAPARSDGLGMMAGRGSGVTRRAASEAFAPASTVAMVVEGEGTFRIGEEDASLEAGEAVMAASGVVHGVSNEGPERLVCLVFMAPHPRPPAPGRTG